MLYSRIIVPTGDDQYSRLRNGRQTATQNHRNVPDNEDPGSFISRRNGDVNINRGLHEMMEFYDDCTKRSRNEGDSWGCG